MNDANAPLNMDFPNLQNANSGQRPMSSLPQNTPGSTPETANVEALISLVQDLNQQNHDLLNRVTLLEGELAQHQANSDRSDGVAPWSGDLDGSSHDSFSPEQVSNLLNQLEFAQQANQRQDIRVESLSTQLTACHSRVEQLEAENDDLQHRCGNQRYRVQHLEDECRDLRLRLQRQQQYTLQFKAALEKCLEVPPPSYGFYNSHEGDYGFAPEVDSTYDSDPVPPSPAPVEAVDSTDEGNWLVQPLFPKVQKIQSWAAAHPDPRHAEGRWADNATDEGESRYESEGPKMPGESWTPSSQATSSAASGHLDNFPKSRFHKTLLTLAHEPSGDVVTNVSAEPAESQVFQPDDTHSIQNIDAVMDGDREVEQAPASNHQVEADGAPFFIDDAVVPEEDLEQVEPNNEVQRQELPTLSHLGGAASDQAVAIQDSGEAHQSIAPFSSQGFEDRSALQSDAKLLKSLASLIDMSAADGLNIPMNLERSPEAQEESDRELVSPKTEELSLPEPWQPSVAQSPSVTQAINLPLQSEQDAIDEAAIPSNSSQAPDQAFSTVADETPVKQRSKAPDQDESGAKESLRRAIDLPSFLTNSVRPNPA